MISLSTGAFYERASRQMGDLRAQATALQQQIGTGQRLDRSSDDPVAAARLRTLERTQQMAGIDQQNSTSANTDLQLTDTALGSVADLIVRAKELATQAASGTLNNSQRASIGLEVQGLADNLLAIANTRNGAGHALFGGQAAGDAYSKVGGTVGYDGTTTLDTIDLGDGQTVLPGMVGPDAFSFTVGTSSTDLFTVLGGLATALQGGASDPAQSARDAMGALDAGLDKVTTAQTVVGARMGWIELMDDHRTQMSEMVTTEQASTGGADIAASMTRLQEMMTVLQASQASFVKLANLSLFNEIR
jgi:flagellar hook-associated protein 3 FlgL